MFQIQASALTKNGEYEYTGFQSDVGMLASMKLPHAVKISLDGDQYFVMLNVVRNQEFALYSNGTFLVKLYND